MGSSASPSASLEFRRLGPADYAAVHQLFGRRQTWMATDNQPVAGTFSLSNYWLNPSKPEWELRGAFQGGQLITTHGTYWSPELPLAFDSKLCSIEPAPFGRLPSTFIHFYNEVLRSVVERGYTGFLSLVTPRLNAIYDRALVRQASGLDRFFTISRRVVPPYTLTGIEHLDLHLFNLTPAPFETLVRETYLK